MNRAIEAVGNLRSKFPKIKVLVLTLQSGKAGLLLALQSRVNAIVLKIETISALTRAVHDVMREEPVSRLSLSLMLRGHAPRLSQGRDKQILSLTERQAQVLHLVVMGKTLKEIGNSLCISAKTVEFHKAALMQGFGLRNSADLIRFAFDHNLVATNR